MTFIDPNRSTYFQTRSTLQHRRAHQGLEQGTLTPAEFKGLQGVKSIYQEKAEAAFSDGLHGQEILRGIQGLNVSSRLIFNLKHNDLTSPQGASDAATNLNLSI